MKNVLRFGLCAVVVVGLSERDCGAAITWNITYQDAGTGFGFDDPTEGATRRNTITAVTNYISSVIDANGVIDLVIDPSENFPLSDTLASAGPFFPGAPGFSSGTAFIHATTGADPSGAIPDATAVFNFGRNWNSGTAAPASGQLDLFSVALHEFTHALGFVSTLTSTGVSSITGGDPGSFSVFDSFLIRGSTGMSLFAAGGDFIGTVADLTSDDVFYDSPAARAANGGNPIKVFSPTDWKEGSSISHIVSDDAVMQFSIPDGVARRVYSPQDLAILGDAGYSIIAPAAVPEPSSYVLLSLVGLACGLKRRRKGGDKDLAV